MNTENSKSKRDWLLICTMIGVIVSVWIAFLLTVGIQIDAARQAQSVIPMLSMEQVMSDVDEIFSEESAEIIHYVYENGGGVTITVDPYNTNVWYVRFVVDMDAGGCAGIAYGYTGEDGWQAWDWGWPESAHIVSPYAAVG